MGRNINTLRPLPTTLLNARDGIQTKALILEQQIKIDVLTGIKSKLNK
jgi:hypothetical protein